MDTEFPGIVARPVGSFKHQSEFQYQTLRCNVDMLKLIQLGLTFTDADGNLPLIDGYHCIWQFNFREFSLKDELYAQDSIELLKHSGIDFNTLEERGIDVVQFGESLMVSGVVLNEDIRWLTFHSGYDFGYLLKLLVNAPLPENETEFFELLRCYFPYIIDIKHLVQCVGNMHGGLSKLAEHLSVARIGPQHQAGSDSLLTAHTFFKLQKTHFMNVDLNQFVGTLYGLGQDRELMSSSQV
ncbi:Ribonuclease H-like domain [Ostreococcus tauri]|uniref:poly(A)-specific ribonuclease n=1 Tax=Ostreococcus tauri TaxID=70448 RepID=A0A090MDC6_OSTTA|nr:Ribonuclease H-like domain [Ostreococcus tauri]CEG00911.1 Ribonuclease H-like domain [Ostreococcus tauri]|eukprot:XP_003074753.2 Ribonuclease H-like domain [Ostreococcus tauri]